MCEYVPVCTYVERDRENQPGGPHTKKGHRVPASSWITFVVPFAGALAGVTQQMAAGLFRRSLGALLKEPPAAEDTEFLWGPLAGIDAEIVGKLLLDPKLH